MALADELRAKIEAGQAATATALRTLADQIEALPLTSASEVLAWIRPTPRVCTARRSGFSALSPSESPGFVVGQLACCLTRGVGCLCSLK